MLHVHGDEDEATSSGASIAPSGTARSADIPSTSSAASTQEEPRRFRDQQPRPRGRLVGRVQQPLGITRTNAARGLPREEARIAL